MANLISTPQEIVTVDNEEYLITAMPATHGLMFMEKNQDAIDKGKSDLTLMKKTICQWATKDNMVIDDKKFDILFARKYGHLMNVYNAILNYNFAEVFQEAGSEE